MKRDFMMNDDASVRVDEDSVKLDFGSTAPGLVALELVLLRDEMVEAVTFRSTSGEALRLRLGRDQSFFEVLARPELRLSFRELDILFGFFLEYFRDGMASVNHVDLEVAGKTGIVDVMVMVQTAREPVSPSEARRRLGLP